MLHYCAFGTRNYHTKPLRVHARRYWEFQVFTSGKACPSYLTSQEAKEESHNFWISRPEFPHGWFDSVNRSCEVAVFHFSRVPETLNRLFYNREYLSIPLPSEQLSLATKLAQSNAPQVISPDALSPLRFDQCLTELCLLFLETVNQNTLLNLPSREQMICDAAVAWFCSHMEDSPDVQMVSDRMGYNVSHLRRIFHESLGKSPGKVFAQQRMLRAAELLRSGKDSITDISMACGFNSLSAFSRAFTGHHGVSPRQFQIKHFS